MDQLGLVVHGGRTEAVDAAGVVRAWCEEHAVRCTDIDVWHDGGRRGAREEAEAAGDPDLVVTLGGDGTFLRGARLAAENDALVLGVDLGRVWSGHGQRARPRGRSGGTAAPRQGPTPTMAMAMAMAMAVMTRPCP